jgi:hypothetical protein
MDMMNKILELVVFSQDLIVRKAASTKAETTCKGNPNLNEINQEG